MKTDYPQHIKDELKRQDGIKNNWKIRFRQLWSSITKENQHLTTERIEGLIEFLLAEQKKELMSDMLDFLKEPEEYCLQHYGYATDKQEDEIYTQGMQDFKAYKIIKLLNKIEKLKHHD